MASAAQNFLRLRRAKGGLRRVCPESATLAVTIIPVSPAVGVTTPGLRWELRVPVTLERAASSSIETCAAHQQARFDVRHN